MWWDIKWCSRPIPLLFYGLGLSYISLFLFKSCHYTFDPDALFACLYSEWATTKLFALKDGGITLSAFSEGVTTSKLAGLLSILFL